MEAFELLESWENQCNQVKKIVNIISSTHRQNRETNLEAFRKDIAPIKKFLEKA